MENLTRFFLLFPALAGFFAPLSGQIALHGLRSGSNQEIILSTFEVLDGIWIDEDTLDFVDAYVVGGTGFDQISRTYYITGLTSIQGGEMNLWGIDITSDQTVSQSVVTETVSGIQHDMNSDRLLGLGSLIVDSTQYDTDWWMYEYATRLVEVDTETGDLIEIAAFPEISGYVVGTVALNSDNGNLFFVGIDADFNQRLYTLDSFTGEILADPILQLEPEWGVNELTYSHSEGKIYGIHREFGGLGEGEMHLAALDAETGAVADLLPLPQVAAFSPDASEFEQTEGSYIIMYYDVNFGRHILAIDVESLEVVADHPLDGSFTEMHVDNSVFAVTAYGVSNVADDPPFEASNLPYIYMYPNPASDRVWLEGVSAAEEVAVFDMQGQRLEAHFVRNAEGVNLDVSNFPGGVYSVVVGRQPLRLVVER
jgi:hypothetical protein